MDTYLSGYLGNLRSSPGSTHQDHNNIPRMASMTIKMLDSPATRIFAALGLLAFVAWSIRRLAVRRVGYQRQSLVVRIQRG